MASVTVSARDKRLLLLHALDMSPEAYARYGPQPLDAQSEARYQALLARRAAGEPVAAILGRKPFWKHDFLTTTATLDPRPESELIIEAVLEFRPDKQQPYRILDCGTGTGCLLLSLLSEYPGATGTGVELSHEAAAIAEANTTQLALADRAKIVNSDWTSLPGMRYDVIVSNPPYIPSGDIDDLMPEVAHYDPHLALDGGDSGLTAYKDLFSILDTILETDGLFVCEIGYGQSADVTKLATQAGMAHQATKHDLDGIARTLVFTHA